MGERLRATHRALAALAASVAFGGAALAQADAACCSDLEQRIAELEGIAARQGNRQVTLKIYGQVSEAIVAWDDGGERNVFVVNNYATKNTIGFIGSAAVDASWSVGLRLDLQVRAYRSSFVSQAALGDTNGMSPSTYETQSLTLRYANWYVESKTLGRLSIGRDDDPALGILGINIARPDGFAGSGANMGYANGAFFLRRSGTSGNGGLSALTWQGFAWIRNGDSPTPLDFAQTSSAIKYSTPYVLGSAPGAGFNVQVMWGQDDFWSYALRYADTAGPFRLAAGASYSNWMALGRGSCSNANPSGLFSAGPDGRNFIRCDSYQFGASIMHAPTGLYVSGGGGWLHDDQRQMAYDAASSGASGVRTVFGRPGVDANDGMWWVQGGWEAALSTLGKTTFWGQYAFYNTGTGVSNNAVQTVAAGDVINPLGQTALIA